LLYSNVEVQKDTTLPGRCNRRLNHVTGRPARYVEFDQYYFSSDEGVRNTYYLLAVFWVNAWVLWVGFRGG
jgi:hypothetical protein